MPRIAWPRRALVVLALAGLAAFALPAAASAAPTVGTTLVVTPPSVTSVSPGFGLTSGGTRVTVTGHGFTGVTSVRFGGVNGSRLVVARDGMLRVTAPAHDAGTVRVRLVAPARSSDRSSRAVFTYGASPDITEVAPLNGALGGGTAVTITGHGFTNATAARFDGVDGSNLVVVNDTTITVTAPGHAAGSVRVRIIVPGSSTPQSTSARFTYVPPPAVSGTTPQIGPSAGGTTVTITGTGLAGVTSVTFDGVAGTALTVVNDTQLTVVSPAHAPGAVDVIVTSPYGDDEGTSAFTYIGPMITDISPTTGTTAGGTSVTITGSGFTGATAVGFGLGAQSFVVVNDTTITAVTRPRPAGTVDVGVETPNGHATLINGFTFT